MIEIILDASQITTFETCPQKWYLDHVRNLTSIHSNPALTTGSWFHEALKFYYSRGKAEPPVSKHLGDTLEYAKDLARGVESKKWIRVKSNPKFHLQRLLSYLITNMGRDDQMEILAVEKGFSTLLYEDSSRRYILEGMIDLITIEPKLGLTVTDHKTQSRFDELYPVNHQLFNYIGFTKANYFRYNYIGQQETQNDNTFHQQIYKLPVNEGEPNIGIMDQWKEDVFRTFSEMEHYVTLGEGKQYAELYPRRRTSCDSSKYGLCQFHRICEIPDNSKWQPVVIESGYKQKENIWKAWS